MIDAERLKRETFIEAKQYLKTSGTIATFNAEAEKLKQEGHADARVNVAYPPDSPADAHEAAYLAQTTLTAWNTGEDGKRRFHWDIARCGVVTRPDGSYALDFKRRLKLVDPEKDNLSEVFQEVSWQPDLWTKIYDHHVWEERLITAVCVPIMIAALIKDGIEATGSSLARTAIRTYNRNLARYWPV